MLVGYAANGLTVRFLTLQTLLTLLADLTLLAVLAAHPFSSSKLDILLECLSSFGIVYVEQEYR